MGSEYVGPQLDGPHEADAAVARTLLPSAPAALQRVPRWALGGPPSVAQVLASSGEPLSGADRRWFGSRLGAELPEVRVHRDAAAARSAHEVGARAYTVGSDVVLGDRVPARGQPGERELLAHELTHVVQQVGATPPAHGLAVSHRADRDERAARGSARSVAAGVHHRISAPRGGELRLQRDHESDPAPGATPAGATPPGATSASRAPHLGSNPLELPALHLDLSGLLAPLIIPVPPGPPPPDLRPVVAATDPLLSAQVAQTYAATASPASVLADQLPYPISFSLTASWLYARPDWRRDPERMSITRFFDRLNILGGPTASVAIGHSFSHDLHFQLSALVNLFSYHMTNNLGGSRQEDVDGAFGVGWQADINATRGGDVGMAAVLQLMLTRTRAGSEILAIGFQCTYDPVHDVMTGALVFNVGRQVSIGPNVRRTDTVREPSGD